MNNMGVSIRPIQEDQAEMVYTHQVDALGSFQIRHFCLEEDLTMLHAWVNQEYAQYWDMSGTTLEEVRTAYIEILQHSKVYIGMFREQPAFLLECYDPAQDLIGKYYEVATGDRGMHILVAPRDKRIPGFTSHIFNAIMGFIFQDDETQRIVVEPDIRNDKIHLLNKKAGFEYQCIVELPKKIARLAFCTRAQYEAARSSRQQVSHI